MFFGAAARGLMPSDRGEQRRDGGQFQLNLGDPSAPYFANIFYHGNKHGCVNISVNVSLDLSILSTLMHSAKANIFFFSL